MARHGNQTTECVSQPTAYCTSIRLPNGRVYEYCDTTLAMCLAHRDSTFLHPRKGTATNDCSGYTAAGSQVSSVDPRWWCTASTDRTDDTGSCWRVLIGCQHYRDRRRSAGIATQECASQNTAYCFVKMIDSKYIGSSCFATLAMCNASRDFATANPTTSGVPTSDCVERR